MSMALSGRYTHTAYGIDLTELSSGKTHVELERVRGETTDPVEAPGSVYRQSTFRHTEGHVWFLQRGCFHTVSVKVTEPALSGQSGGRAVQKPPVLTLFVKDHHETPSSKILALSEENVSRPGTKVPLVAQAYDERAATIMSLLAKQGEVLMEQISH